MLPGLHKNTVRKAQGWTTYVYAWRGGPCIARTPFFEDKEAAKRAVLDMATVIASRWAELREGTGPGTFSRVLGEYSRSPEYNSLSKLSRVQYDRWIKRMDEALGALTVDQMGRRVAAEAARLWRDKLAESSVRNADYAMTVLSAICTWGRKTYRLPETATPTRYIGRLYSAPEQATWSQADIDKAMSKLPKTLTDAIALGLNTGLRRTDLAAITWSAIDEAAGVIRWRPSKGKRHGRVVVIPLTPELRATLARIERKGVQILMNSFGRPWTATGLGHAMKAALEPLGIDARLHGLRRAAATRLALQGRSSRQIARQLGWSESEAEAMAAIYVNDEASNG